ncbi:PREDICTED: protein CASC2, isoform 3-like [Propithecus coquereli]|uniref:protein CASC2, isoform 3-like n=1 Tax=Propithecus coquereli TaxID=379532 RepID=UPI00063FC985|nr:PREDICTED: protein CASC2, isoform 3-like [Propithecus coquereli]
MHPHLFRERGANPHPHRTAGEKIYIHVSEKQLILWRLKESSTQHNSGDIKGMKHFRCAFRQRRTFCLDPANHPWVVTINPAEC